MQAFPIVQPPGALIIEPGMTLQDYFAAAVDLTPYADLIREWATLKGTVTVADMAGCIASIRYAEADAMLAARRPIE